MMMEFLCRKVTVVDLTEDLYARILPRDYVAGTECDPFNCTAANAIKRKPGVAAVKVLNAVSFVVFDDSPEVAVRYWNYGAHSSRKTVKRHDNKKLAISDGGLDIRLKPPTSTNRLLRSMNKADAKNSEHKKTNWLQGGQRNVQGECRPKNTGQVCRASGRSGDLRNSGDTTRTNKEMIYVSNQPRGPSR